MRSRTHAACAAAERAILHLGGVAAGASRGPGYRRNIAGRGLRREVRGGAAAVAALSFPLAAIAARGQSLRYLAAGIRGDFVLNVRAPTGAGEVSAAAAPAGSDGDRKHGAFLGRGRGRHGRRSAVAPVAGEARSATPASSGC